MTLDDIIRLNGNRECDHWFVAVEVIHEKSVSAYWNTLVSTYTM